MGSCYNTSTSLFLGSNQFYPTSLNQITLPTTDVNIVNVTAMDPEESSFEFTLTTNATSVYTFLSCGDFLGYFSNNGMLLRADQNKTIQWHPLPYPGVNNIHLSLANFTKALSIMNMNNE